MSELADFWRISKEYDYFIGAFALGVIVGYLLGRWSIGIPWWQGLIGKRVITGAIRGFGIYIGVIYAVAAVVAGGIIIQDVFFADPGPAPHTPPAALSAPAGPLPP